MRKLVLTVFCLFFISLVSAGNITIDYPNEVEVGEVFEVDLELVDFDVAIYDIKIDIVDSENSGNRLARIYDGDSWQSSYNYVDEAIDTNVSNSSIFQLNITEDFEGTANITVKVRDTSSEDFEGYQISIKAKQEEDSGDSDDDIYVEIEWDEDDIINGEEFEIKIRAYNLRNDKYDVRVWIEDKDDNVISERYGDDDNEEDIWKSGRYYAFNFIEGPGDETKDIDLRIDEDYRGYEGGAVVYIKIRENDETDVLDEDDEDIDILEKEDDEEDEHDDIDDEEEEDGEDTNDEDEDPAIITLGSNSSNVVDNFPEEKNSIIYKSKNEYIKEYSVYVFCFLCIALIALLLLDKR